MISAATGAVALVIVPLVRIMVYNIYLLQPF